MNNIDWNKLKELQDGRILEDSPSDPVVRFVIRLDNVKSKNNFLMMRVKDLFTDRIVFKGVYKKNKKIKKKFDSLVKDYKRFLPMHSTIKIDNESLLDGYSF